MTPKKGSVTAFGVVENGTIRVKDRRTFDALVRNFGDTEVVINIEPIGKRRSLRQLRYWWGVIVDHINQYTGWNDQDKVNEYLKSKFNGQPVMLMNQFTGEILDERWIGNTQRFLTTTEFMERKEQIQAWAQTELGLWIPDPDEPLFVEKGEPL